WLLKPVKTGPAAKSAASRSPESRQAEARALSVVERATMSANRGSPATETGASAAAAGWAAARATLGSERSRETARATPQDMAILVCWPNRGFGVEPAYAPPVNEGLPSRCRVRP